MTRAIRCIIAFGIIWSLQAGVAFAENDWWDHASGPGPFWGLFIDYRFACVAKEDTGTHLVWLKPTDRTALPTLWTRRVPDRDQRTPAALASSDCKRDQNVRGYLIWTERLNFNVGGNRLVPDDDDPRCTPAVDCDNLRPVRIWSQEIGYMERLPRGFAVGAVAGINRFAGSAFEPFYRASLVPTIEWDPFARGDNPNGHWLKIIVGTPTVIFKGFTTSDFCNRPGFACQILKPWKSDDPDLIRYRISLVLDFGLRSGL